MSSVLGADSISKGEGAEIFSAGAESLRKKIAPPLSNFLIMSNKDGVIILAFVEI